MKKIILTILSAFIFVGCTEVSNNYDILTTNLKSIAEKPIKYINNHNKSYYSYYVEPSIKSNSSNDTSSVIDYEGNVITLNIDVNNILDYQLNKNDDDVKHKKLNSTRMMSIDDLFIDYKNEPTHYIFEIYEFNDQYLLSLKTKFFVLESIQPVINIDIISKKMMIIAKSINVDIEKILVSYSNRIEIYTEKEKIELYKPLAPENGTLSEILDDSLIDEFAEEELEEEIDEENIE